MGALKAHIGRGAIHLCIDMQRLFAPGGPWAAPWMERVLPVVTRLVEHAPRRTVFTRFITPWTPDDAGGMWRVYYGKWVDLTGHRIDPGFLELLPALASYVPPARVVDRNVYCAFGSGTLHPQLQEEKITTLIVTGS